ncbi:hypothetical protein [Streptomyces sp. KR80]|uniref:hypothetical protein n=1 Tax=Streptomyces sp. KR80 TaxID=3457426 RepID=UPI003FD18E30
MVPSSEVDRPSPPRPTSGKRTRVRGKADSAHAEPLPRDIQEALRNGPFEAALDGAIRASGLSLDRIQHRLAARGIEVSVTTLSYWRRGRSRPERPQSRQAIRLLEDLLELPTDSLVSLLGPQRPRGRWIHRAPVSLDTERLWQEYESLPGLLDDMGSADDGLLRLAAHDRCELDHNGAESRLRTTLVLRAERERVDRCLIITRGDDPDRGLPELSEVRNARPGRIRYDASVPLVVTELFLDRVLSEGETSVIDYAFTYPTTGPATNECNRGFRAPARLYTLEVAFHPSAVPVRCHRCSGPSSAGSLPDAAPVWISSSGRAHLVVQDPTPGFHGLRWEWV